MDIGCKQKARRMCGKSIFVTVYVKKYYGKFGVLDFTEDIVAE